MGHTCLVDTCNFESVLAYTYIKHTHMHGVMMSRFKVYKTAMTRCYKVVGFGCRRHNINVVMTSIFDVLTTSTIRRCKYVVYTFLTS